MRRLMLLEINEVERAMIERVARRERLSGWLRLLSWPHVQTTCDEQVEHRGLDPWVQWVGIHTGQPRSVHGVLRLGDGPRVGVPQLWERIAASGLRSGVWGALNSTRRGEEGIDFHVPDPWADGEQAWPAQLQDFVALPLAFARSYTAPDPVRLARAALRGLRYHLQPACLQASLPAAPEVAWLMSRHRVDAHLLAVLHDLVAARQFLRWRRRSRPHLSILFQNGLAHLSHHRWTAEGERGGLLRDAIVVWDRLLREILDDVLPGEHVLFTNGLDQKNVCDEPKRMLYRQRDHQRFPLLFGLRPVHVEPLMTNEAHLVFETEVERDVAAGLLAGLTVHGQPLLEVCTDERERRRLFYQIIWWGPVEFDAYIEGGPEPVPFYAEVTAVGYRTGAHVSRGWAACTLPLPMGMPNHQLGRWVLSYFGLEV